MNTAKSKAELIALLQAVAANLGASLDQTNFEGEAKGRLTMPDGVKMFINADEFGNSGKLSVSSSYPSHQHRADGSMYVTIQRDFSNAPTLGSINISYSKTPAQIANDITRRFLAAYAPLYAQAVAYCQRQADYWSEHNSLASVAAEVLKPLDYQSKTPCRVDYIGSNGVRVTVDDLDADKLRKLAAFLQTL